MKNTVAIVGRPNVGKSTLFNRLTEGKRAIVHESSGVTRDRHYGVAIWNGVEFNLIDTGGYSLDKEDSFGEAIRQQVLIALNEADVIIFLTDVVSGITAEDDEVAKILRKTNKPVITVVNKVDNTELYMETSEFYKLGMGNFFSVSSINGAGTGDMLDALVAAFPKKNNDNDETETEIPRFAIVGRPNAGKSLFVNTLLGEDRNIVTPISGTTRDSLNTRYKRFGKDFILVDTAGLRKKSKVNEDIEFYSTMRSIKAIENSDVCLLMVDAEKGFEAQDQNIMNLILKNKRGVVVLVNKWDLIEKDSNTAKEFEREIKARTAPFTDYTIIFISALEKQRLLKAIDEAERVYHARKTKIQTAVLNKALEKYIKRNQPPAFRGKYIKIKYAAQLPTYAPNFAFYCNYPDHIKEAYRRYLENNLRNDFDFKGVPIELFFRKK